MSTPHNKQGEGWPVVVLRRWSHHGPDDISSYSVLRPGAEAPPDPHGREGETYVPESQIEAAESKLSEIEAERDDWCQKAHERTGWGREWRSKAETAQQHLQNADNRIAEALYWLNGGDPEAAKAALERGRVEEEGSEDWPEHVVLLRVDDAPEGRNLVVADGTQATDFQNAELYLLASRKHPHHEPVGVEERAELLRWAESLKANADRKAGECEEANKPEFHLGWAEAARVYGEIVLKLKHPPQPQQVSSSEVEAARRCIDAIEAAIQGGGFVDAAETERVARNALPLLKRLVSVSSSGEQEPNVLSSEEATALVAAYFSEDHEVATLGATIKRLGDWLDGAIYGASEGDK